MRYFGVRLDYVCQINGVEIKSQDIGAFFNQAITDQGRYYQRITIRDKKGSFKITVIVPYGVIQEAVVTRYLKGRPLLSRIYYDKIADKIIPSNEYLKDVEILREPKTNKKLRAKILNRALNKTLSESQV